MVEDAISRRGWKGADVCLEQTYQGTARRSTVRGLLEVRPWRQKSVLLLPSRYASSGKQEVNTPLEQWILAVARGLGEREPALRFQREVLRCLLDVDAILEAYRRLRTRPAERSLDALFCQWQNGLAQVPLGGRVREGQETWLHGVLQAQARGPESGEWRLSMVEVWLGRLRTRPEALDADWPVLAAFAVSPPGAEALKTKLPWFSATVL